MEKLYLNEIYDKSYTKEQLFSFLQQNTSHFKLVIYSDTYFRSYIDVMIEHLQVAYIIEEILKYSDLIDHASSEEGHIKTRILELKPIDKERFIDRLIYVSPLRAKEIDPDEDALMNLISEVDDFESRLDEIIFKFHDEIDNYYANYVNAGIYEYEYDEIEKRENGNEQSNFIKGQFSKKPEFKYGFWQGHIADAFSKPIFFSTFSWIVDQAVNIDNVLENYSGIDNKIIFENAEFMTIDKQELILNNYVAVDYNSLTNFLFAIKCIDELILLNSSSFEIGKRFQISRNTDIVKIYYKGYFIIYFSFKVLRHNEIKELYEFSSSISHKLSYLMGFEENITCDWKLLNDEKFEELCYEIIYNNIRFDNQRIRKMGKSRSRDGGRDIEVYTKSLNGENSRKFIIQCKFSKGSGSLTKTKLPEAANIIKEYQAEGYMIMTNLVIDATLYDMLDGFGRDNTIDTKINFSKYELEHYLTQHKYLKERYFK
jgi:hypothetical protein